MRKQPSIENENNKLKSVGILVLGMACCLYMSREELSAGSLDFREGPYSPLSYVQVSVACTQFKLLLLFSTTYSIHYEGTIV